MGRCATCGSRQAAGRCPRDGAAIEVAALPPIDELALPGGYALDEIIARGGFGTVVRARRLVDDAVVAIKVAHRDRADAAERLAVEAESLRAIGPPHVPKVYEHRVVDGTSFLAMELLAGETLADWLATRSYPLVEPRREWIAGLFAPVAAAHRRGLVHRDLKPENIFVGDASRPWRLVDFGLARRPELASALTAVGAIVGSSEYMSPEQCAGEPADARSDIYALGVILYELFAGFPPFWGSPSHVRESHRSHRPRPLATSTAVDEIVRRCLSKSPAERFGSVDELAAAWAAASRVPTVPPSPRMTEAAKPSPSSGRNRRTVALIEFAALADAVAVSTLTERLGGCIAHVSGDDYVVVFDHEAAENLGRLATLAAQRIIDAGMATRAFVDIAELTVTVRPDGRRRYVGARLMRRTTHAGATAVALSEAAVELLGESALASDSSTATASQERSETIVIGRSRLVAELLDEANRTLRGGPAAITTVLGDRGLGKSHLLTTLESLLRDRADTRIICLRAREPDAGNLDDTLQRLLRLLLEVPRPQPPDAGRGWLAERLGDEVAADVWPGVALLLDWVPPDAPELRDLMAVPGVLRAAVGRAAGESLLRVARERPLALMLDDAHFADDATLDAIEYAASAGVSERLWILTLARPSFHEARPRWGERAAHQTRQLGPLEADAGAELCRRLLHPVDQVPDQALHRLVDRTRGVPLLLVELVRGLKRSGAIRRHPHTQAWTLATDEIDRIPDLPLVEWLARRELDALSPALAAHACLLAMLGGEASCDEAAAVLDELERGGGAVEFPLDAQVAAQRLLQAKLLERSSDGRLRFRHELLRDEVRRSVSPSLAERVHSAAYRYYVRATGLPESEQLARVALHAEQIGRRQEAAAALLTLAKRSAARHAYVEAETQYTRGLALLPEGDARVASTSHARAIVRSRLGRFHEAVADLERARELTRARGDAATESEVLLDAAMALDWVEDYEGSRRLTEEAAALVARVESPLLRARLLLAQGRSLYRANHDRQAADHLARATAAAAAIGADAYETQVIALLLRGYILATLGQISDSQATFDRVVQLCTNLGDRVHLAGALNNRLMLWIVANRRAELLADADRLRLLGRELGYARFEQEADYHVGLFLCWSGDLDEGEVRARHLIEVNDRWLGGGAAAEYYLLLARILAARGDIERLRTLLVEFRRRQAAGAPPLSPSEQQVLQLVDLAATSTSDDEWNPAAERLEAAIAGGLHLGDHLRVEFFDLRGRAAQRRRDSAAARASFRAAQAALGPRTGVLRSRVEEQLALADCA